MASYKYLGYLTETFQDIQIIEEIVTTFQKDFANNFTILNDLIGNPDCDLLAIKAAVHKLKASLSVFHFKAELDKAVRIEAKCLEKNPDVEEVVEDIKSLKNSVHTRIDELLEEFQSFKSAQISGS